MKSDMSTHTSRRGGLAGAEQDASSGAGRRHSDATATRWAEARDIEGGGRRAAPSSPPSLEERRAGQFDGGGAVGFAAAHGGRVASSPRHSYVQRHQTRTPRKRGGAGGPVTDTAQRDRRRRGDRAITTRGPRGTRGGQPTRSRSGRATASGLPEFPLSRALARMPQLFAPDKINVVSKYVDRVDALPSKYRDASVLFLSHNSISSLAGLSQFRSATMLSLAHNKLADMREVERLRGLANLRGLNLEGNPLTAAPHYRLRVVRMLPSLETLDGKPIKPSERRAAEVVLRKFDSVSNLMIANECRITQLKVLANRLALHTDLWRTLYGGFWATHRPAPPDRMIFNLEVYLRVWDLEGSLTADEREGLREELVRQATTFWNVITLQDLKSASKERKRHADSHGDAWERAFAEVMSVQQSSIAKLTMFVEELMETGRSELTGLRSRDAAGIAQRVREEEEQVRKAKEAEQASIIEEFRTAMTVLLDDEEDEEPVRRFGATTETAATASVARPRGFGAGASTISRASSSDAGHVAKVDGGAAASVGGADARGRARTRRGELEASQRSRRVRSAEGGRVGPSAHPYMGETASKALISQRLREAEHLRRGGASQRRRRRPRSSSPPTARSRPMPEARPTLDDDRQRFGFRGTSTTSTSRGRARRRHEDDPAAALNLYDDRVTPAAELPSLRKQVELLSGELAARQEAEERLTSLNLELRDRVTEFAAQNEENVQAAEAEIKALQDDLRMALEMQWQWQNRVKQLETTPAAAPDISGAPELHRIAALEAALARCEARLMEYDRVTFDDVDEELVTRADDFAAGRVCSNVFLLWRRRARVLKISREAFARRAQQTAVRWFAKCRLLRAARAMGFRAEVVRLEETGARCLQAWHGWARKQRGAKQLCERALARRCFAAWGTVLKWYEDPMPADAEAVAARSKLVKRAERMHEVHLTRRVLVEWSHRVALHKVVRRLSSRSLRRRYLSRWKDGWRRNSAAARIVHRLRLTLLDRAFNSWVVWDRAAQVELRKSVVAYTHFQAVLRARCVRAWALFAATSRLNKVHETMALNHFYSKLLRRTFAGWTLFRAKRLEFIRRVETVERTRALGWFRRWALFAAHSKREREKSDAAYDFSSRRQQRAYARVLRAWKSVARERRMLQRRGMTIYVKHRSHLRRRAWAALTALLRQRAARLLSEAVARADTFEEAANRQTERVAELEADNVSLMGRMQDATEDATDTTSLLRQRDAELKEAKAALQRSALLEGELRGEVARQKALTAEAEADSQRSRSAADEAKAAAAAAAAQLEMTETRHRSVVADLEERLHAREVEAESLAVESDRLKREISVADKKAQQREDSVDAVARKYKALLQDRDDALSSAEKRIEELEQRVADAEATRDSLTEDVQELRAARHADARQLGSQLSEMEVALRELDARAKQSDALLAEKNGTVRRLVYELRMSEQRQRLLEAEMGREARGLRWERAAQPATVESADAGRATAEGSAPAKKGARACARPRARRGGRSGGRAKAMAKSSTARAAKRPTGGASSEEDADGEQEGGDVTATLQRRLVEASVRESQLEIVEEEMNVREAMYEAAQKGAGADAASKESAAEAARLVDTTAGTAPRESRLDPPPVVRDVTSAVPPQVEADAIRDRWLYPMGTPDESDATASDGGGVRHRAEEGRATDDGEAGRASPDDVARVGAAEGVGELADDVRDVMDEDSVVAETERLQQRIMARLREPRRSPPGHGTAPYTR